MASKRVRRRASPTPAPRPDANAGLLPPHRPKKGTGQAPPPATPPTAAPPAALTADLTEALKRLKLATVRRLAPEVLATAKVQRWAPEEVLRTLIEAEIAARDESNLRGRLRGAGFPVTKTLDEFKVAASSVPQTTFDYLAS